MHCHSFALVAIGALVGAPAVNAQPISGPDAIVDGVPLTLNGAAQAHTQDNGDADTTVTITNLGASGADGFTIEARAADGASTDVLLIGDLNAYAFAAHVEGRDATGAPVTLDIEVLRHHEASGSSSTSMSRAITMSTSAAKHASGCQICHSEFAERNLLRMRKTPFNTDCKADASQFD
jgi:hypothetical protein